MVEYTSRFFDLFLAFFSLFTPTYEANLLLLALKLCLRVQSLYRKIGESFADPPGQLGCLPVFSQLSGDETSAAQDGDDRLPRLL
jgi:hypothetical protein